MSLFGSNRDELRRAYSDAWRKRVTAAPLTPLEALIADVIGAHPEYQPVVQDSDAAAAYEPSAVDPAENPFLHMGLHLAVREQVSIDRPPGVRELKRRLAVRLGDDHDAEHVLMEALAETLWQASRSGQPPDEGNYLMLARHRLAQG
jgi:hypothetical protein